MNPAHARQHPGGDVAAIRAMPLNDQCRPAWRRSPKRRRALAGHGRCDADACRGEWLARRTPRYSTNTTFAVLPMRDMLPGGYLERLRAKGTVIAPDE